MKCGENASPASVCATTLRNLPYNSSLATSGSASSASIFSDTSSQSSIGTPPSVHSSDSESCESLCPSRLPQIQFRSPWHTKPPQICVQAEAVPAELRQNPRRTSSGHTTRTGLPPPLVRQADRKIDFVDHLVDSSTQIVEAIWPLSSAACRNRMASKRVLPLRTFIQETLRRSRTSYSTLQVALYYLILIKPHIPHYDFTMEQLDDDYSNRVLQCGRRMFLAALILASKYLQDRNYSARAWSKISGLPTQEINQNEMAFLSAVKWKLHIAEEVYNRWTDIVRKYTPPPTPPSPGAGLVALSPQASKWTKIILKLNPELDNIDGLLPSSPVKAERMTAYPLVSPTIVLPASQEMNNGFGSDADVTPTPPTCETPVLLEPNPTTVLTPGRQAPALGLLPTPRLTPQMSGFNTPAAGAAAPLRLASMGLAMAHANSAAANQILDRVPGSLSSSPVAYFPYRRSSLATTVSTASSPESMVSDTSRTSRSSSISSSSSFACAPPAKLGLTARPRFMKSSERMTLKPIIATVPEDFAEVGITSSPDSYTGPEGKLGDLSFQTPLGRREMEVDNYATDAARALTELHFRGSAESTPKSKPTLKRSRPSSNEHQLQDNVRDLLHERASLHVPSSWMHSMVRGPGSGSFATNLPEQTSRKRVCCASEVNGVTDFTALPRPSLGTSGPGMWDNIL